MKRILKTIFFLLSGLILTSCLKVETKIFVNKDGSGTITEKVLISPAFIDMMNSFAKAFAEDESEAEEFSIFDEEKLENSAAKYGENVTFVSGAAVKEKGWEGYQSTYTFEDISKVKMNTDQSKKLDTAMPSTSMGEEEEEQPEYFTFSFTDGPEKELVITQLRSMSEIETATEEIEEDSEEAEESTDDAFEKVGEQFLKLMEDMHFSLTVEVDGKVTNSSATYTEGSEVTLMRMDFKEMMENKEAFEKLTKTKPKTIEEMKEFVAILPGMEMELEPEVRVKFK